MAAIEVVFETLPVPAMLGVTGFDLLEPTPVPPDPVPGDRGTPLPTITATRRGRRIQALLCRTVTHEPIGELRTAEITDWEDDVDGGEPGAATVTASSWDPTFSLAAAATTSYRGRPVYEWDPKGYELLIGVDGVADWTGVFRQPLDIGGDRQALAARQPGILLNDRPLGRVEQEDLLDGWGDFENYASGVTPPGMYVPPGMTATVVRDAVRGRQCLEVTGQGYVRTPIVAVEGQVGVGRTVGVSAFAKSHENVPAGTKLIYTHTQQAGALTPDNPTDSERKLGVKPESGTGWSDSPVSSGATMTEVGGVHYTWGELRGFTDNFGPARYDVVRMQQGILSGFLTEKPYSRYIVELFKDLQYLIDGQEWGITTRVEQDTTAKIQMTWAHNQHQMARACMDMVDSNVDGGAAWTINPAWVCRIMPRLGRFRTDLVLSPDTVLECRWAVDPGAEADDFIADTGRGSGTTLVTSTVSQPVIPGRHRITTQVRPPDGSLNAIDAWTRHHAAVSARRHATAELDVRWDYARLIAKGDILPAALVDGNLGWWTRPLRVLRQRWRPGPDLCTLTVGTDV